MRCNVGCEPTLLADQHLIAEYSELAMVPGQLRKQKFNTGKIPIRFSLGFSHMNFFKDKLEYLQMRKIELTKEMQLRGFITNHPLLDLTGFPSHLYGTWKPTIEDSLIVRTRISERLVDKPDWYRFNRKPIGKKAIKQFSDRIMNSPCFYV